MNKIIGRVGSSLVFALVLTGCSQHKIAQTPAPGYPPPPTEEKAGSSSTATPTAQADSEAKPSGDSSSTENAFNLPPNAKPIFVETGIASWYGPPYHNRRGSDGTIYDMNAMTAAHRTLPLGSIVRVTNLKTGNWTIVRITDRGPFIAGRILDLSLAAARKIDVVRAGLANVRLEVLQAPVAIDSGGRWAVQIGGFDQQTSAEKMVDQISRRYHSAKVSSFSSPIGDWWVRVRVVHDDRLLAQEIVRDTHADQGKVFLVRLD